VVFVQAILEDLAQSRKSQQTARVAQQALMAMHEKQDFERILQVNREQEQQDAKLASQVPPPSMLLSSVDLSRRKSPPDTHGLIECTLHPTTPMEIRLHSICYPLLAAAIGCVSSAWSMLTTTLHVD
jgi:hypothetical protein